MSSAEHRFGSCDVVASVRLKGAQPIQVRGVTAVASPTGGEHLAVRIAGVLLYLEDREAFEAVRRAVVRAEAMADQVFDAE